MQKIRILLAGLTVGLAATVAAAPLAAASDSSDAKTVVVVKGDLPKGFTGTAHDPAGDEATAAALAACAGVDRVKPKVKVNGKDWEKGSLFVSSSVNVYPSKAVAKKQFKGFQDPDYQQCAQQYFSQQPLGPNGEKPTQVQVQSVTLPNYGKDRVAYVLQAEIPGIGANGAAGTITSIQTALLDGRAIVVSTFNGQDAVFPQKAGFKALARMSKRLHSSGL
jgi:hypothetical protein